MLESSKNEQERLGIRSKTYLKKEILAVVIGKWLR